MTVHLARPRFINQKRNTLVLIAHLHLRIAKIQRVGQSARVLPTHIKEGDKRRKSTGPWSLVRGTTFQIIFTNSDKCHKCIISCSLSQLVFFSQMLCFFLEEFNFFEYLNIS